MKKTLSVLLCALLLTGCISPLFALAGDDDFVPVIRFVASSDSHIKEDSNMTADRIGKMMDLAYERAGEDENYREVDALLVVGDLTNDGTVPEFEKFSNAVRSSLRDDTRFLGVVAKNHDGWGDMNRREMRGLYSSLTGNEPDFHVVINGYHFIGLSASPSDASHYDAKQLIWLKKQLDEAVKDDPEKPVFVMHHEGPRNTVYGSYTSEGWGVPHFGPILNLYPQVVDFSGHSHYPLNDPRTVWQGRYTAIGTGALYYVELDIDGQSSYDPPDCYEVATCWLIELDARNRMRMTGIDVNENEVLCQYLIENPAKECNRPLTPAKRKLAAKAPEFEEGAAITAEPTVNGCKVTVPAARSTDGMPVVLYRAYATDKLGALVEKVWTLPKYYRAVEENEIVLNLEGLNEGEFTVYVVAENAYGEKSAPLKAKIQVEGDNPFVGFFKRIGLFFSRIVDFIKDFF